MSSAAIELLERELEVAEMAAAIDEARDGRGQLLVVQAPAGLGKTSLLGSARRIARDAGPDRARQRAGVEFSVRGRASAV